MAVTVLPEWDTDTVVTAELIGLTPVLFTKLRVLVRVISTIPFSITDPILVDTVATVFAFEMR